MTENSPPSSADLASRDASVAATSDLLDITAVCKFFGGTRPLHPATIYRGIGIRYPRPVRVSPNVNRWLRSECEAALQAILAEPREPLPCPKRRSAT